MLGLITVKGGVLVGDSARELVQIVPPSSGGERQFVIDPITKVITWKPTIESKATTKGQLLWVDAAGNVNVLTPPTSGGSHWLRYNTDTQTYDYRTTAELFHELIPSGTTRPAGLGEGRIWIDEDA